MRSFLLGLALVSMTACAGSTNPDMKRTQEYLKLYGNVQAANDKLATWIQGEQKTCEAKDQTLQMTGQGILACVAKPKPTPVAPPPAPEVKK